MQGAQRVELPTGEVGWAANKFRRSVDQLLQFRYSPQRSRIPARRRLVGEQG